MDPETKIGWVDLLFQTTKGVMGSKRLEFDLLGLMHVRRMVFIVACATVLCFYYPGLGRADQMNESHRK